MLLAVALAGLFITIASLHSGPTFVTHERSQCQHSVAVSVVVSPLLSRLTADRRLLLVTDRIYRPRPHRSPNAVFVSLLLLLGGVETNPGPVTATVRTASRSDALSLGLLNVRSARHKAAVIHDVIDDHRLDVLAMTETWIPSDAPDAVKLDVAPPGYNVVHRHRGSSADKRGGGVALIHRETAKATVVDVGDYTEFESLAVKLTCRRSKSALVVCVYRPPGAATSAFTDQLSDLIDQLVLLNDKFVIVGDFNVPGDVTGQLDRHVVDVFDQYSLRQHVSTSTHINGNILDLILSQDEELSGRLVSDVTVQSVCFSDHHLLTCRLGVPPVRPVTTQYTYRPLRRIDTAAFSQDILRSELFGSAIDDVDEYADLFDAEVKRVLDIHAPLRTGRRRCGKHESRALSDEAREAKQLRRRRERRYRRTGLQSDKQAYLSACTAARDSITKSRADHIKAELDEVSGDIGATWRTAQKLLHSKHKVVYNDAECAKLVSTFCEFFVDKVRRIRDNISQALQSSVRRVFAVRLHHGPALSLFQPVTIDEVRKLLLAMPNKSSPLDVLPCSLLKTCADVFAPAIVRLANLSMQAGKFPSCFKKAQVLPLLKKPGLDSSSPANYRPISNLSTVSKVLERLVLARLRPHLLSSSNFSQFQSAYRKGHSTETALLDVLDNVYMAANDKQVTVLIGLDLSAAFDTVDHATLLDRLQTEFGVTETPLAWLRSYLEDRTQFVKLGQHQSSAVALEVGVPQGSVLGPLLFAVYCSPVGDVINDHGVRYHQYADDTQLHLAMSADNTAAGLSLLATCTTDVRQWYMQNGLQLNPDKSEAMIVGTSNQLRGAVDTSAPSVSVAGVDLPVADEMKVLGVVLDRRLTFAKHASMVARSCNYHVQAIRHIRHLLTTDVAQTLACSLILSRIDYCNAVLHGAPTGTIQKLQRAQNNAARIVKQAARRCHAKPLLHELHWLPVQQRITYKVAVLTYKVRSTLTPAYLHQRLAERVCGRVLRSSAIPLLHQPFARTDFARRAYQITAPSVWNSLPASVLDSSSLAMFKSRLKTFLFKQTLDKP